MRRIAVVLLIAVGGCGPRAVPAPPEPAARPPAERVEARPRAQREIPSEVCSCPGGAPCRCATICVVQNGVLRNLPAGLSPVTGELTARDGRPLSQIAPLTGEYAAVAGWYVNDEAITFRGRRYRKYGLPRVLGHLEVARIGEYSGVGVYAEAADTTQWSGVVYLPTRPGCEFHPYVAVERQARTTGGGSTRP